jgi:VWFA-related protein
MPSSIFRFFGVLCALTVVAGAQERDSSRVQGDAPTISTNVPLVLVPVTVTDRKGNLIDGLTVDNFVLADDGARQQVHMDTSDTVLAPVSLVVAVQCSGISAAVLAKINRVGGMIQPLITGDKGQAAVIAFDDDVRVFQDFTGDASKIRVAFERVQPRVIRAGKMLDAVSESVRMLATRNPNHRRILLMLSESRDRGSKAKLPEVIEMVQRAGVTVYPATYSSQATPWTAKTEDNPSMPMPPGDTNTIDFTKPIIELARLGKTNAAEAFARATGGRHLSFETLKGLEDTITRTGEEIHSQYLLSFVPQQSKNKGFHRIEVLVPSRADVVVRARPGYWPQQQ